VTELLRFLLLVAMLACGLALGCADDQEGVAVGSCSDGQDNDGDGSIDCEDPGCCGGIECGVCADDENDAGDDDSGTGDDDSGTGDDDSGTGDDDSGS